MIAQVVELINKGVHPFHDHSNVPFTAGCTIVVRSWCSGILQPRLTACGRMEKAAGLKWSALFSISYLLFVFSKFCSVQTESL